MARFSSLYIGILAATRIYVPGVPTVRRFSSLYIGILAATCGQEFYYETKRCFSSLYIGILAATTLPVAWLALSSMFQFPLHRDPRCNREWNYTHSSRSAVSVPFTSGSSLQQDASHYLVSSSRVSVPFTSGSSLQQPGVALLGVSQ